MFRTRDYVLYTPQEIAGIRAAAQATARVRDELAAMTLPGMTTAEVDALAERPFKISVQKSVKFPMLGCEVETTEESLKLSQNCSWEISTISR